MIYSYSVCVHADFFQSCSTLLTHGLYVAHKAPLSMGFFRQEYWSGFPSPPQGDLPDSRIKPVSLTSPALASEFLATSTTWEVRCLM